MVTKRGHKQPKVLQMIDFLIKENRDDPGVVHALNQVRDRIKLPMVDILRKIPGGNVRERAALCGVSKQAYYQWLNGTSRPNPEQAERIAKLTGYSARAIRGTTRRTPTAAASSPNTVAAR